MTGERRETDPNRKVERTRFAQTTVWKNNRDRDVGVGGSHETIEGIDHPTYGWPVGDYVGHDAIRMKARPKLVRRMPKKQY